MRKKPDLCYTPKLRLRPILAHKNKISEFYSSNINITMRAEGISGNFVLVRAWQPKITSDHPSFCSTSDGNCFVLLNAAKIHISGFIFPVTYAKTCVRGQCFFKNIKFYACFLVYFRARAYYCSTLQYERDNTLGRISTQLVLASQVRLALAFSSCGLSMFLLRLLSVFTRGHRFGTACLNSLSKPLV